MANVALSTIRTVVRNYIDEPTPGNWSNADLNTLINFRYHRVYASIVNVFQDYNVKTSAVIPLVIGQQEYGTANSLPTDIFKMRRVEINLDSANTNSVNQRAFPMDIDAVRDRLNNTTVGLLTYTHPNYYFFGESPTSAKLGFVPIPDKTGTFQIWYIKTLADLSSDSDTIDIPYPERYWSLIATGAAADALRFGAADSPEADKFDAIFDAGIARMEEELRDKTAEEAKGVLDVTGDYLDFGHSY